MKIEYSPAELEVIELVCCDVVTISGSGTVDDKDDYNGLFDGSYDPGAWT